MIKGLPSPTPGAADVAKLTTSIGAALAALWYPPAALAAPFLPFAIDKFIERPQRLLIAALKKGDLEALSDEQAVEFVPMAYRFMEAAKQGEYEHTLKVLAAFIAGELGQDLPEAGNFARMARRVEGLTMVELRLIASIAKGCEAGRRSLLPGAEPFVEGYVSLSGVQLDAVAAAETRALALQELMGRGLLRETTMANYGGTSHELHTTPNLWELVDKAGAALFEAGE